MNELAKKWKEKTNYYQRPDIKLNGRILAHQRRELARTTDDGTITHLAITVMIKKQKERCAFCGTTLRNYHMDHIMPLAKGGKHGIENIQILCENCNRKKEQKTRSILHNNTGDSCETKRISNRIHR